ncbi:MAG: VanZ family protein [Clostridia bacterium]|nr:VanZ family protein [Clostridia bacterium]
MEGTRVLFNKLGKLWKTVLVCFAAVVLAEAVQLIFILGSFDVDDIILNRVTGVTLRLARLSDTGS